jgi:hypothetical protein
MASVRKMGDLNLNENAAASSDTKSTRRKNGKVDQLEEQRRIRKQMEMKDNTDDGFVPVGQDENNILPPISLDERLAMTFNSIRVSVTILRPVLNHPHRQDFELKMKNGASIDPSKEKGDKKKVFKYYLFFDHVYEPVRFGTWKELTREFTRLLEDLDLPNDVVMKRNKDGSYHFDIVFWIKSILEQGQCCLNGQVVAKLCLDDMPRTDVESQLHEALMSRFDFANDEKQMTLKNSINELQKKLTAVISNGTSSKSRLTVYGSCLSGLALEGSHDVDVSVYIPQLKDLKQQFDDEKISASRYEKGTKDIIYMIKNALKNHKQHGDHSFIDLFAITAARVPVIKGVDQHSCNPYSANGHLHFDLCFLNDIAVVNSSLLREYSLLDRRVRVLMLCVKSFAKKNDISSAADNTFSSYGWLNLVVFYLQCIEFLPVLQCPMLMEEHGFQPDKKGNSWHYINSLETYYLTSENILQSGIWQQPDRFSNTTMPELLYGFFNFYANVFPRETVVASIRVGDCSIQKASFQKSSRLWRMSVEDPFETWDSHVSYSRLTPQPTQFTRANHILLHIVEVSS